jgi:hypothetical protein
MHILYPCPVTFFNIARVVRQFPLLDQASAVPKFASGRSRIRCLRRRPQLAQDVIDICNWDVREK